MKKRIGSLFLVAMLMVVGFASVVPMGVVAIPPPMVDANGPYGTRQYALYEGDTVTFHASIFRGNAADYQFRWDVTGDGEFDGPGPAPDFWGLKGETDYSHLYLDDYYEKAKVEAWDGIRTLRDDADVWVENVSPFVFNVTATPNPRHMGLPVEFTAQFDDPGLKDTWEYRWDFGDGTYSDWLRLRKYGGSIRVLLLHSWGSFSHKTIENITVALGEYAEVVDAFGIGSNRIPELSMLLEYDVVFVSMDYYIRSMDAVNELGNVLANYSDLGGGVVQATFSAGNQYYSQVAGRWMAQGYNPLPYAGNHYGFVDMGTVYDPNHMIMDGVNNLSVYFKHATYEATPGATLLADYQNNVSLCAYTEENHHIMSGGRIVGLNILPWPDYMTNDGIQIVANAIMWASQHIKYHDIQMPISTEPVYHRYMELGTFEARCEVRDDDHEKCLILDTPRPMDFQDFESGAPTPADWPTDWYEGGNGGWRKTNNGYLPSSFGYRAQHDWYSSGESSLYSPVYDFSSLEGIIVDWEQIVRADHESGDSDGYIEVSADGGTTWKIIYEWHHPVSERASHEMGAWAGTEGSSKVQLRLRCYMDNDWYWEVDNINIMSAELYTLEGIGSGSTNVTIIYNNPPIANAGGPFYSGFEGSAITFDAGASIDPDGNPLQYRWDFESDEVWDTDWSYDPLFDYAYLDDYDGLVTVEVTDGYHLVTATAEVDVFNVPPEVSLEFTPDNPTIIVDFMGSFLDPGLDNHTYTWDFGDGTVVTGNLTMVHVYFETGTYDVDLEVEDDDGGIGTASVTVYVSGPTIVVDSGGGGDYLTIQEAVDAAQPYDLIVVKGGVYMENVVISKPLSLIGEGYGSTVINGGGDSHGILIESSNVSVSLFTVRNCSDFGVKIESGSVNVHRMEIVYNDRGIGVINGEGSVDIHDNWIHDNNEAGILVEEWTVLPDEFYIQYNRLDSNGHYGIHIENNSNMNIIYNRNSEINIVSGTPNGIYGNVKSIFLYNSDNITIDYNTFEGYSEFGILDLGMEEDFNVYNVIRYNTFNGTNSAGTVGIVTQYVETDMIRYNNFINNGWWGAKSLSVSILYNCFNWNYYYHNGYNLPFNGEFPSNWPDTNQGDTSRGGGFYYDPLPGEEVDQFVFDGNILIDNPIGIMVEGDVVQLILSNNTIKGSEIAIYVESGDPIIENNRLTYNVEGINIVEGSPVIQGNIIDHNDVGITVGVDANPQIGENVLVHNGIDVISPNSRAYAEDAIALLEEAKTGNKWIDKKLDKAIDFIQRSLNIDPKKPDKPWKKYPLWVDDNHLDLKHGHMVFSEQKKALVMLIILIEDSRVPQWVKDICQEVIDKLIASAYNLAKTAYNDAQAYAGDRKVEFQLRMSQRELSRAESDLALGDYFKAIDDFKKTWKHAQLAIYFGNK